jgi:hypothetical protein
MGFRPSKKQAWGFISAVCASLIANYLYERITKKPGLFDWIKTTFYFWIKAFFNWIKALFSGFLSVWVPLWAAVAVALLGISLYLLILYIRKNSVRCSKTIDFREWKLKWEYPDIRNTLYAVCKKCKYKLYENKIRFYGSGRSEEFLYCPNCEARYSLLGPSALDDAVKVILEEIKICGKNGKGRIGQVAG